MRERVGVRGARSRRSPLRLLWRAVLFVVGLALGLALVYELWVFGHVWWWVEHNPASTAFMDDRLAQAREKNPKAQFRKTVPLEQIKCSPRVADPLGIMDCSGVSDGSAAAIVVRAEDAHKYTDKPIFIKALAFAAGPAEGFFNQDYDFTTFQEVVASCKDAYRQAGIENPREEINMAEVHDCFTATELVLMEDMGFSPRGQGWKDVLDGRFDGDGAQPVNPDGGLKSFGHPIGASGLRMMYEMWLQLRGEAGPRQIRDPKLGLTHNLGGQPGRCVSFVSIVGR